MIGQGRSLPTTKLSESQLSEYDIVSTDLFDTLLLRDLSSERSRFDEAASKAARRLGVDPGRLSALRRSFHAIAYKAVSAERPLGDASLAMICKTIAAAMGCGEDAARLMHEIEVETDISHLSPNRKLVALYDRLTRSGQRVIAMTDTYYSEDDIRHILDRVLPLNPIAQIYASCEIGLTKHSGALFAEVARREGVSPGKIVHLGDDPMADVVQGRAAGLDVIYLPRPVLWRRAGKLAVGISGGRSRMGRRA